MFIFIFSVITPSNVECISSHFRDGQQNPAIALEGYISAYSKCDFRIPLAKIYQNVNFQLTSSCEIKDIPISTSLRTLLSVTLEGKNGF